MSSSWDPETEGDLLGVNEFQNNLKNIQQGFDRSKENAILREKLSGLSTEEVQSALQDLEKREQKKQQQQQQQQLQNKIQNELE
jgi:Photosynthesis affected mutant 68